MSNTKAMINVSVMLTLCKPPDKDSHTISGTEENRMEKIPKHRDYAAGVTYLRALIYV